MESPAETPISSNRSQARAIETIRTWLPILLTCLLISLYSAKSGDPAPELELTLSDKRDHFFVYAIIATLTLKALPRQISGTYRWLTAFALVSAFGFADEIIQHFNPSRTGDPLDWFADSLGALFAVVAYTAWPAFRRLADWTPKNRPHRSAGRPMAADS